jgi:CRP/FNR family cyclic AMP-dependent transcriptional regulator
MARAGKAVFDAQVFVAKVGAGKTILAFQKHQNVFVQGDVADTVFYIQKGKVKVTVLSDQGKEAVVGILGPGQFVGEGCMNGHKLRISTATAMDHCVITAITKDAMLAALHAEPKFSEMFMAYLLTRNNLRKAFLKNGERLQRRCSIAAKQTRRQRSPQALNL